MPVDRKATAASVTSVSLIVVVIARDLAARCSSRSSPPGAVGTPRGRDCTRVAPRPARTHESASAFCDQHWLTASRHHSRAAARRADRRAADDREDGIGVRRGQDARGNPAASLDRDVEAERRGSVRQRRGSVARPTAPLTTISTGTSRRCQSARARCPSTASDRNAPRGWPRSAASRDWPPPAA